MSKDIPIPTKMVSVLGEEEQKLYQHYSEQPTGRCRPSVTKLIGEPMENRDGTFTPSKSYLEQRDMVLDNKSSNATGDHRHRLLTMTREERISELEDKLEKAMNYDFDLVETIQEKIDLYNDMTDEEYKSYIRIKLLYTRNAIKPIVPSK